MDPCFVVIRTIALHASYSGKTVDHLDVGIAEVPPVTVDKNIISAGNAVVADAEAG